MKPLKERLSITVDSDVIDVIKKEAEEDSRPLSQYINLILKEHISKKDKKKK
ncbi:MAG: toxin-antitoxin system protein [Clostridia bacterium]|nr:toxin-antitoxin system protein [Clostridia bacterium]